MSEIQEIVLPTAPAFTAGYVMEMCDALVCTRFRVERIRETTRGHIVSLRPLPRGRHADPLVEYFHQLLGRGVIRKVAIRRAVTRFKISRPTFYRRLAKR